MTSAYHIKTQAKKILNISHKTLRKGGFVQM